MSLKQGGETFLGEKDFQMLQEPGNSLYSNAIENVWSLIKKNVSEKHAASFDALQAAITEVWEREISSDSCCKLIDNMHLACKNSLETRVVSQNIDRKLSFISVQVY